MLNFNFLYEVETFREFPKSLDYTFLIFAGQQSLNLIFYESN